jgi:hypothetical protein
MISNGLECFTPPTHWQERAAEIAAPYAFTSGSGAVARRTRHCRRERRRGPFWDELR